MPEIKQAPDRIWLQPAPNTGDYRFDATWHWEPIGEPDMEEVEYVRADLQRPTPAPVVWRFKRPNGRWEYDEGVGPPKIVGGLEAWEAKGWIFEALYNDKEVGK